MLQKRVMTSTIATVELEVYMNTVFQKGQSILINILAFSFWLYLSFG